MYNWLQLQDLLGLKTLETVAQICIVFIVGSALPNVLMKICSLWKTGNFILILC